MSRNTLAPVRSFEDFPEETLCPLCGTNDHGQCILVTIEGTARDGIAQAAPTHLVCLVKDAVWYPEMKLMIARGHEIPS